MNSPHPPNSQRLYALQLTLDDPSDPARIAGQLEHVLSGRRHHFTDGPSLLACLLWDGVMQAPPVPAPAPGQAP